jgi:hypothetical protein
MILFSAFEVKAATVENRLFAVFFRLPNLPSSLFTMWSTRQCPSLR